MHRSRDQIMTEWDAIRSKMADGGCATSGPREWLDGVLDEQDRIIADLVRKIGYLKYFEDAYHKQERWTDQAKSDAGFNRNVSFDDVWAACLSAYKATR